MKPFALTGLVFAAMLSIATAESGVGWVSYPGGKGPGAGKHVVLLAGDEEYRSEEAMPMLGKILSKHHGFKCTVLFSVDDDGTINPNKQESVGKPETLDSADVIVMSLRFRKWPDEAMKHFDEAIKRGIPVIGLRTSTHAFQMPGSSGYQSYSNFGKNVLGEGWVSHWGDHKKEATRGVIEPSAAKNPLLNGVTEVFGDSDVYEAAPPADATILMRGQVLEGMDPDDKPADREKKTMGGQTQKVNEPMMPIAWTRVVKNEAGTSNKILCTTMGAATDLESEGLRRLVVNGVFGTLGLPIPPKANVTPVDPFKASKYSTNAYKKNLKAEDYELGK